MKKWIILAIVFVVFPGGMAVAETDLPDSGKYIIGAPVGLKVFAEGEDIKIVVDSSENMVKITVPLLDSDEKWQLFASWAWTDDKRWILVPSEDYSIDVMLVESGNCKTGYLALPRKGTGWYWIRIWGQHIKSEDWLPIMQDSKYCRNDTAGNPGYEFLVHPTSGRCQTVPNDYQIRR